MKTLLLIIFSTFFISGQAQVLDPYDQLHPQLSPDSVDDEYFSYQWGLVNYGQTLFEELAPLEYMPVCGKNFEVPDVSLDDLSAEEFFLGSPGRSCVAKAGLENNIDPQDYDLGWANYILDVDKLIQRDVVVAILDFGLDYSHPDIKENIAKDLSKCNADGLPIEPPRKKRKKGEKKERDRGAPPISEFDFSTDCLGWNFTDPKHRMGSGFVFDTDADSHGTHIAGIVSAVRGNGIGVSGMSNRIKVLPVKVLKAVTSREMETLGVEKVIDQLLEQVALGLEYVAQAKRYGRKIDAINLSFGWPNRLTTDRLQKAIQSVLDQDITIVAAAGNEDVNVDLFPCSYPGVICVGAHTNEGKMAGFSNYGSSVDMLAPGQLILSLNRTTELSKLFSQSEDYDFLTGTSQAAPFVTGAAAILKGVHPQISTNEIKARLYSTALPILKEDHRFTLSGRLQLASAVMATPRPYLRPQFKQLTQIEVDKNNIQFALPVKNLWQTAKNVSIKVKSLTSNIVLNKNSIGIGELRPANLVTLNVSGRLLDLNQSSRVSFQVDVDYQNKSGKKYSESFNLTTELYIHLEKTNYTDYRFELRPETLEALNDVFANNPDKLNIGRILTKKITPTDIVDGATEYFVDNITKIDGVNGIEISAVIQEGERFVQKRIAFLPKTRSFRVNKLDLLPDVPGEEYVIRSLSFESVDKEGFNGFHIEYFIVDKNFNPVMNSLRLKPMANLEGRNFAENAENIRFEIRADQGRDDLNKALSMNPKTLVSEHSNFNKLFFLEYGQLSDEDNASTLGNFDFNELNANQIYYLDKVKGENQLKLRTFSSPQVRKDIKQMFVDSLYERGIIDSKVIHPDMIMEFWHIFNQNSDRSEINVLASFAMESQVAVGSQVRQSWEVNLNTNHFFVINIKPGVEDTFDFQVLPFDNHSEEGLSYDPTRDRIMTYFALNRLLKGDYLGIKNDKYSKSRMSYLGLRSNTYLSSVENLDVESASPAEALLTDLISYRNGERFYSFYKTVGEILMTTTDGKEVSLSTNELKISDFISQFGFKELMVPSLYTENNQAYPSIFVNASEIHSRRVYSWVVGEGSTDLVAPVHLNVEVSNNCLPLAPSKIKGSEIMNYTFLCKGQKEWFFRYVPIQKWN